MKNFAIVTYPTQNQLSFLAAFKESILYSNMHYSSDDLQVFQKMSSQEIENLIQKAIQLCQLVGIQSESHFKKIYVYNSATNRMSIDWRISKKGFNLLIMQCNKVNHKVAHWLWTLADI